MSIVCLPVASSRSVVAELRVSSDCGSASGGVHATLKEAI